MAAYCPVETVARWAQASWGHDKAAAALGHDRARWLAAAAYDRWLMHQGKPQKYGTQYQGANGQWRLYEVDPATTDAERAEWNVPPLAHALQRLERMNAERPPPAG